MRILAATKAPSPLRSAGALQTKSLVASRSLSYYGRLAVAKTTSVPSARE